MNVASVLVEISPGELIDKITILEIKHRRIEEPGKRANVATELACLVDARDNAIVASPQLNALTAEIAAINQALWDIEDAIRAHEARNDFGPSFIALARSVYQTNDRRSVVKRKINDMLGARLTEEKSYARARRQG